MDRAEKRNAKIKLMNVGKKPGSVTTLNSAARAIKMRLILFKAA
jgi:hypothetical protein